MTQFARGNFRNDPNQVGRLGEVVGLAAPGIAAMGVDESGLRQADQIRRFLDAGAALGEGVLSYQTRQNLIAQRERDELAAASEDTRQRIEQYEQGKSAEFVATLRPALLSEVESGRLAPAPGESDADFAGRVIESRLPADASQVFKDRARTLMLGSVAQARQNAVEKADAAMRQEVASGLVADVAADPTARNIARFRTSAARGYLNPAEQDAALAQVMGAAASAGNREAVATIAEALGDRAPLAVAAANARLEDATREFQNREIDAAMTGLALETDAAKVGERYQRILRTSGIDTADVVRAEGLLERFQAGRGAELTRRVLSDPGPIDAVLAAVEDGLGRPATDPMHIRPSDAGMILREGERRADDAARAQWQTTVAGEAARLAEAGGLINLSGDVETVLPSGATARLARDEVVEAAIGQTFARIDAETPDPQANLFQKIQVLGRNGVTHRPFQARLSGGVSLAMAAIADEAGGGAMPPEAAASLLLYQQMRTQNPAVAAAHTSDDEELFYQTAGLAMRFTHEGNAGEAMRAAARVGFERLPIESVRKPVERSMRWLGEAGNAAELSASASQVAALLAASGVPADAAADEAAKIFKERFRLLDGEWVDVRTLPEPLRGPSPTGVDGLERFLSLAREQFLAGPEAEGVEARDLTLRNVRGAWTLWNKTTASPASTTPAFTFDEPAMASMLQAATQTAVDDSAEVLRRRQSMRERVRRQIGPEITRLEERERALSARLARTTQPLDVLRLNFELDSVRRKLGGALPFGIGSPGLRQRFEMLPADPGPNGPRNDEQRARLAERREEFFDRFGGQP